jgi:hypothetical protein
MGVIVLIDEGVEQSNVSEWPKIRGCQEDSRGKIK